MNITVTARNGLLNVLVVLRGELLVEYSEVGVSLGMCESVTASKTWAASPWPRSSYMLASIEHSLGVCLHKGSFSNFWEHDTRSVITKLENLVCT